MSRWPSERRKDAWAGSNRKSRLPADWDRLRAVVLQRCGFRCEWDGCGDTATDVDHIEPGDHHSLSNLQGLCGAHHRAKSSAEGIAAQQRKRALRFLPPEKQPGVIDGPPTPTEHRGF